MDRKWMFQLSLFESEVNYQAETSFPKLKTEFEITDLSEKWHTETDAYGKRKGVDWSTIDKVMKLHWYLERVGDHKSFSFRKKWDGTSASLLFSLNWTVFHQAVLSVHKLKQASYKGTHYHHIIPVASFTLSPAEFRFIRHEPFVGGERFGIKFASMRQEFK
jgi:hypothetical protein